MYSRLKWAGERAATLGLYFPEQKPGSKVDCTGAQAGAMRAMAHWKHLRCFNMYVEDPEAPPNPSFIDELMSWIFQRAPALTAVRVLQDRVWLDSLTLANLRHLEISALGMFSAGFEPARQMPMLETLCLGSHAYPGTIVDVQELNLAVCLRLTHLALSRLNVAKLTKPSTCSLSIKFCNAGSFEEVCQGPTRKYLGCAEHIHLAGDSILRSFCSKDAACGTFANVRCLSIEGLSVVWKHPPDHSNASHHEVGDFCMTRSMPAGAHLLRNVKVLDITAGIIKGTIPGYILPNLEQLYVTSYIELELSFEDPALTATKLTRLLLMGHPLIPDQASFHKLSRSLHQRGLTIGTFSTPKGWRGKASGVYLRRSKGADMSNGELFKRAARFLEELFTPCRCRACFECLERSGCIDPAWRYNTSREKDQEEYCKPRVSTVLDELMFSSSSELNDLLQLGTH